MKKPWLAIGLIAALLSGLIVIALVWLTGGPSEPEYQGRKLSAWLDELNSPSSFTVSNADLAIKQMGTNAVPFLIEMLHAKDSPFKLECIRLLARQHWVHIQMRDDFQIYDDALQALRILGPDAEAATPDLAEILLNAKTGSLDDMVGTGYEPAYILSQIGPSALPVLENALTCSNALARQDAAIALGYLGNPSTLTNLLIALKDPDSRTRCVVVEALQWFPAQTNVIVPVLINCLDDPDCWFVESTAATLGRFGAVARPAIPKLLKLARNANCDAGWRATVALMKIDYDGTMVTFTNDLESSDVNVRRNTAWALMYFESKGEPAEPFLVNCLKDADTGVRENAAIALCKIGEEDPNLVIPALIEGLDNTNETVRNATFTALGSLGAGAKPAVPQILKLMEENKNKGDGTIYMNLSDTLSQIDPQTAAKLHLDIP